MITTAVLLSGMVAFAQDGKIGINEGIPKATLDITPNVENSAETANTNEGILIPRLSKTRIANIDNDHLVNGTLVYVKDFTYTAVPANSKVENITTQGFYYYDGNTWQPIQRSNPKFEYILSNDGSVLVQWMDKYKNVEIDMNNYPDMADVKVIDNALLAGAKLKKFVVKEGVKIIGTQAFNNADEMEVVLPNSIEEIKASAFWSNKKLGAVTLPNLKKLESNAFSQSSITSISAANLLAVDLGAFGGALELTTVDLPKVEIIDTQAFNITNYAGSLNKEGKITTLNIPNVVTIGNYAFGGQTQVTQLNLPKVKTIGEYAFGNNRLTSINLPEVVAIGNSAFNPFYNNSSTLTTIGTLTSLTLPKVETIGISAFANNRLTTLDLPNIKTIGDFAFSQNYGSNNNQKRVLTTVTLGPNITSIGAGAFYGYANNDTTNFTITIQATTPPTLPGSNPFPSYIQSPGVFTIRVPSASVAAYKAAWANKGFDVNRIVGY